MDEDMLDYFRMYIEDLRHAEYEIPEQVSEVREQRFWIDKAIQSLTHMLSLVYSNDVRKRP